MSDGPRLLIYSQDGLGLGHLRRTTLLASEFLTAQPGASVMTISDSPLGLFFPMTPGHDYLKLPSIRKVGPGDWQPVALAVPFDDALALRRQILRTAALQFAPDVFLVDHMPQGAMGELLPALEALRSRPARIVLGVRDILDAPATVRRRWQLEGALDAVERHFDRVLVYGSQDVFDVAAEYAWPESVSRKLRYCGYVCSPMSLAPSAPIRRRYLRNIADRKLVVAMAGGGADAHGLFATLLRALPALWSSQRCVAVIITGPFLPAEERAELQRLARGLPAYILPVVNNPLSYLAAADLIVGMAGYNTTAEILGLRRRALLVPRQGPSAEQQMRASRFAERGWVRWLPPDSLSATTLADAVLDALAAPVAAPLTTPDLQGRQAAAAHLVEESNLGAASWGHEFDLLAEQPLRLPASAPLLTEA